MLTVCKFVEDDVNERIIKIFWYTYMCEKNVTNYLYLCHFYASYRLFQAVTVEKFGICTVSMSHIDVLIQHYYLCKDDNIVMTFRYLY